MADELTFRAMTQDEVRLLVGWAADEGWNPGLHDAELFWKADPEAFVAAELGGELVGGGAIVSYGGTFGVHGPLHRATGVPRSGPGWAPVVSAEATAQGAPAARRHRSAWTASLRCRTGTRLAASSWPTAPSAIEVDAATIRHDAEVVPLDEVPFDQSSPTTGGVSRRRGNTSCGRGCSSRTAVPWAWSTTASCVALESPVGVSRASRSDPCSPTVASRRDAVHGAGCVRPGRAGLHRHAGAQPRRHGAGC